MQAMVAPAKPAGINIGIGEDARPFTYTSRKPPLPKPSESLRTRMFRWVAAHVGGRVRFSAPEGAAGRG